MNEKGNKDKKYTEKEYNKLLKQLHKIREIIMQEELPTVNEIEEENDQLLDQYNKEDTHMNEKDNNEMEEENDQLLDQLSKIETILKQKELTLDEKEKLEKTLGTFIKIHKVTKEVEDKDLSELMDEVYRLYEDEIDDDDYFKIICLRLERIKKRYLKGKLSSKDQKNLRESLINVLSNPDNQRDADEDLFRTLDEILESLKRRHY